MLKHRTIIGSKSIIHLKKYLKGNIKVFLLTGKKSFKKCGAFEFIKSMSSVNFTHIIDVSNKIIELDEAIKIKNLLKESESEVIVAIGGGGVIDMAKLINILLFNNHEKVSFLKKYKSIKQEFLPLYVLPTTSGTGSEETSFATVFYKNRKYSINHPNLIPTLSIVDPDLTFSLPSYVTACSGFDALSQCIESYWSISSTNKSRNYSVKGMKLITKNIVNATLKNSKFAKHEMAIAANLSGKAINISKTTAPHSLSYEITRKLGIPHGHAVSLLLGKFFLINNSIKRIRKPLNMKIKQNREKKIFKYLSAKSAYEAHKKWYKLMDTCGLKTDFTKLGLRNKKNIKLFVDNVNVERLKNHPIILNKKALESVFMD